MAIVCFGARRDQCCLTLRLRAGMTAVIAGVYLHGLAGDVAREKMGEASMIAGDLIANLSEAFKRAKQQLGLRTFAFHG